MRSFFRNQFIAFLLLLLPVLGSSQVTNHWEAAIVAENNWKYRIGNSEPPSSWNQHSFNDQTWNTGKGGFGYSDGDDQTIIPATSSIYLRKEFDVFDVSKISALMLHADYDDAFVAYLNGAEICRANIGNVGTPPRYNDGANGPREALLYQGGLPQAFTVNVNQWKIFLKQGKNTLAVQVHNTDLNSSDLSSLIYLMVGITDNSRQYQALPSWFPVPIDATNLPLFIINTSGIAISDEPKIDAFLGIVDNGPGNLNRPTDPFNGYNGKIGIESRGSSSAGFSKKNYGFETRLPNGENNNVSLLGLPVENDWILHGPYSDKSLMRNVLSYHIGRVTGEYAPRTKWCEVILNGEYIGLYVLIEKIKRDKKRVDISNLQTTDIAGAELTGGYIFSVDRNNQGPNSGWSSPYTNDLFYRYRDPNYDELVQQQKDYLKKYVTLFEEVMDDPWSGDDYKQFVNITSWVNYWIATEVFKHIDNYKFSFYLYKRKSSNGGKIHFGPLWDLNLAYGNYDFGQNPDPNDWSYVWANQNFLRPSWVVDLSEKEEMQNRVNCRWQELRNGQLHTDSLMNFIDQNVLFISDAQVRNFKKWPILGTYVWPNSFVGNTYANELEFLKNWLRDRLVWMDDNMLGKCTIVLEHEDISDNQEIMVFPNPFQSHVNFYLENTQTASYQLVVLDAMGTVVLQTEIQDAQTSRIELPNLTSGMYYYQLRNGDILIKLGKLVKE